MVKMTSLEKKIREMSAKKERIQHVFLGETIWRKDVLEELGVVAQQIREKQVSVTLEHTHPSVEFWKGWNKAIEEVLGLLVEEGEK
jgi:hypothetical protein